MSTYKTTGIILRRRDYGEADRIYTILTLEGKVSAIAKGVRRIRAKLASHLEVFSEIDLMFARGKNLDVVTSARTCTQYSLSHDYERLRTGFLFLEMADKLSDQKETENIYLCLREGLSVLETQQPKVVELAFKLKLLDVLGQKPQLETTFDSNQPVRADTSYNFDMSHGGLVEGSGEKSNSLSPEAVKLWRLCLRYNISDLARISGSQQAAIDSICICDRFYEYMYNFRFTADTI